MKIFNCSSLAKLKAAAVDVMNFRGASHSAFVKCEYKGRLYIVKICFYHKIPGTGIGLDGPDAELLILEELRKNIIEKNISPCIIEMLAYSQCEDVISLTKTRGDCIKLALKGSANVKDDIELIFCRYVSLVRAGLAAPRCSFLMLEMCDITLDQFLRRKQNYSPIIVEIIRAILFQVIHAFYALKTVYPNFHHYDLHTQNVMLLFQDDYKFDLQNIQYMKFYVAGKSALVPYFGVVAKIIDFGYSSIPERGINSSAANDPRVLHSRTPNDLLFLFHHIYYAVQQNATSEPITAMLAEIEPTAAYIEWYADYLEKMRGKISSYKKMVQSAPFSAYYGKTARKSQIWADYDGLKDAK
jgi:serine/threonine protein kinase